MLQEARDAGMEALLVRADVTSENDVRDMHTEIRTCLGPVDILVLNASREHPQRPIEELGWEDYQRAVDDFLKAPYLLTRACLPDMKARRWGRIITISSDVLFRNVNHYTAYVAGKSAEIGFTRSLATELAPFGVTVNTVAPDGCRWSGTSPTRVTMRNAASTKRRGCRWAGSACPRMSPRPCSTSPAPRRPSPQDSTSVSTVASA